MPRKTKTHYAPPRVRKPGKGSGGGRPRIDIDPHQFIELARIHSTREEVAAINRCSISVIDKLFLAKTPPIEITFTHDVKDENGVKRKVSNTYKMTWAQLWEMGWAQGSTSLRRATFRHALAGDSRVLVHMSKAILKNVEVERQEFTGKGGAELPTSFTLAVPAPNVGK